MVRQLQNLVGHIPQPKAVRGADALAGVRDLTPPRLPNSHGFAIAS